MTDTIRAARARRAYLRLHGAPGHGYRRPEAALRHLPGVLASQPDDDGSGLAAVIDFDTFIVRRHTNY